MMGSLFIGDWPIDSMDGKNMMGYPQIIPIHGYLAEYHK